MNGWENYETWNVSLWINNDEYLYNIARRCYSYEQFRQIMMEEFNETTGDGVRWDDNNINEEEINENIFDSEDF